jgi:SHS2 domain-containing protein
VGSHRFFDHTGDFGAALEAETREELYAELARAFVALLTGAPEAVRPRETRELEVAGLDATDLLVALGNELLFLFDTEGFLVARLSVKRLDEGDLAAVAHGEPYDPERHSIARPVKAVTHHGAEVTEDGGHHRARVIFDL